jgi:hypothetical protein
LWYYTIGIDYVKVFRSSGMETYIFSLKRVQHFLLTIFWRHMYKVRTSMKSLLAITKDDNSRETINAKLSTLLFDFIWWWISFSMLLFTIFKLDRKICAYLHKYKMVYMLKNYKFRKRPSLVVKLAFNLWTFNNNADKKSLFIYTCTCIYILK